MRLAIFDIDGTLTDTSPIDDRCFVQAIADVFAIDQINEDWSAYDHCTDMAILSQLIRERMDREATVEDFARLRQRFVELLRVAHAAAPSSILPVRGACELLARLSAGGAGGAWRAALATGGWEETARLKLRLAGLVTDEMPGAFSEDGPSREQIIGAAIARARARHQCASFHRIVSIGDGVWDVRAAAALRLPFIGIGSGERAARLRAAGASIVLPDFSDPSQFEKALDGASVPVRGAS